MVGLGLTTACGDRRVDDAALGQLVATTPEVSRSIDVARALTEVVELRRALATPHSALSQAIGPHHVSASSSVTVESGGAVMSELSDKTEITIDADGSFRASADNSRDYGRHATFVDNTLYLRPRYGKYHRRAPATETEPNEIRNEMFSTTSAYFELLYSGAGLKESGDETVAGRPAKVVAISFAGAEQQRDAEPLAHKKWRESIAVSAVSGTAHLDAETGFPLSAEIKGTITFLKEAKRFTMNVSVTHAVSDIGKTEKLAAPAVAETVSAPTLRGEVDQQRQLLEGLSPAGEVGGPR